MTDRRCVMKKRKKNTQKKETIQDMSKMKVTVFHHATGEEE